MVVRVLIGEETLTDLKLECEEDPAEVCLLLAGVEKDATDLTVVGGTEDRGVDE
jgi:hypothetical protein